ncbi:MAG TPA: signal peptidase I [Streptosporangiaceae bacterium]|nr:signal peptidase I [Streptosporangiaceae bacterium]
MTSAANRESGPADPGGSTAAPGPADPGPPGRDRRGRVRAVAEWGGVLLIAVLLAAGLRTLVFQPFSIPSASMVPTLDVGDRILVQKAFFNWHSVHEGDIVVFKHPPADTDCSGPEGTDLVKRVIALPGQTIYSSGNDIYVNGRRLPENYLPKVDPLGPAIPGASASDPYRVPAGEFYVLGDHREISCDSRYWGPVQGSTMVGKAVLLWWRGGHPDFHGL